jgi:hypothetical protein
MKCCEHGCIIPETSRATLRAPDCLQCHEAYLEAQATKSYLYRQALNDEEREAYREYQREYKKTNRVSINTRRRLRRAERRLIEACNGSDLELIQKRRFELAMLGELLQVFAAW